MTKGDFLNIARDVHGYKYQYLDLNDTILLTDSINLNYNDVFYIQKVSKHLMGRCPEKNTPKKTTDQFIIEAKKIWGNKYDYSLVEYTGALKKVKIIYDGIVFQQVAISHLRKMAPEDNMNHDYFIKKAKDKWGNKYDYSLVEYKNNKTKVNILYNDEVYSQTPSGHLMYAPENIKLTSRKTTEQFVKEANEVHDYKFDYSKSNYIKNQVKVIITCPIHGDFLQTPLSHLQGSGCLNCNESKGEKKIDSFLRKNNILYVRQHKFDNCRNTYTLPFDFYIPSMRTAIEFDGKQHFYPMDFFGGISYYENLKMNDKIKTNYCEDNYINLIRIRYDQIDKIWEILWENLKTHIKLRKI